MPTWPSPVSTTGMDADTDSLPRSDILDLTTKFNDVIALRGAAGGICDLDGSGKVPTTRLEAKLAAIAGLTGAADKGLHFTGAGAASVHTLTAYIRTLLDDADADAARTTLGLATVAQAEAEAGTATTVRAWTAERVKQAVQALAPALPAATASVNGYMTSTYAAKLDGIEAGANVGVPSDIGSGGAVRMLAQLFVYTGGPVAPGDTIAGSNLRWPSGSAAGWEVSATNPSGTWRSINGHTVANNGHGAFQRIS